MNSIKTMKDLVYNISINYRSNIKNINYLKDIIDKYNGSDWKKYIKLNNNYEKEIIYRNNNYELSAITWMPHSKSYIHNNPYNGYLYKILEGNLVEDLYTSDSIKFITRNYYNQNDTIISSNLYLYNIINQTNNKTISLHLYSPPLYNSTIFNKNI